MLYYCTLYSAVKYTKAWLIVEDARMWQWTPDMKELMWLDLRMYVHIFESSQLEASYVGDLLFSSSWLGFPSTSSISRSHPTSEPPVCSAAQSCPILCNRMYCIQPGSFVRGISQARVLEWVAISFSRGSSRPRDQNQVSHIVGRCFTVWATREAL